MEDAINMLPSAPPSSRRWLPFLGPQSTAPNNAGLNSINEEELLKDVEMIQKEEDTRMETIGLGKNQVVISAATKRKLQAAQLCKTVSGY